MIVYLHQVHSQKPVDLFDDGFRIDTRFLEWIIQNGGEISFDDGYRNNLRVALPILEKFDCKALVFVATSFIAGESFPYELDLEKMVLGLDSLVLAGGRTLSLASYEKKKAVFEELKRPLKNKSFEVQEKFIRDLADINTFKVTRDEGDCFMEWDEVVELDRHPLITIGAHTHRHSVLTRKWPLGVFNEIVKSRDLLQAKLGHRITSFAYPYGAHSWLARQLTSLAGFEFGYATDLDPTARQKKINPCAIPRVDPISFRRFIVENGT